MKVTFAILKTPFFYRYIGFSPILMVFSLFSVKFIFCHSTDLFIVIYLS
ncbi:hypothetical protein Barb6_03403 [Bacteroidales bacterium Barb6]|nr:hypothetical protein Barb6_03403 [Bacteroidales bacterium Barb6]